jgi:arylsulfatase A-like enzyme
VLFRSVTGKRLPYTEATNVPFFVRWPARVAPGSADTRFAVNVDVAPTILAATGVRPRLRYPFDGRDLLDPSWVRGAVLHEHWRLPAHVWQPTYASLRTRKWQFIEYHDAHGNVEFREYYDLRRDPLQHENLLADDVPGNDPDVPALHRRLESLRGCAGAACP